MIMTVVSSMCHYSKAKRSTIDFEGIERAIVEENVTLFLLCNPHNPVGRVWTEDELKRLGDICIKHNVLIVSDEIHADFVWKGHTHKVLLILVKAMQNTVSYVQRLVRLSTSLWLTSKVIFSFLMIPYVVVLLKKSIALAITS